MAIHPSGPYIRIRCQCSGGLAGHTVQMHFPLTTSVPALALRHRKLNMLLADIDITLADITRLIACVVFDLVK